MSDVIDRPVLDTGSPGQDPAADHRLRHPSEPARAFRPQSIPGQTLAGSSEDLRRPSAHALYRHHALSALLAADRAPRRLAADRRPARLRSRFHAPAAPRSARHRVRHPAGARHVHLLAAEPGIRRGDPARRQRLADGELDQPRAAAQGRDPGRAGRHRGGGRRDRALRQGRAVCADQCLAARQRAAGPPPLLADLCARAGTRPAARHPCRRLWRPRADRRRLAVLLRRGASIQRPFGGGAAFEPGDRGRPGALSRGSRSSSSRAGSAGSRRPRGGWTGISTGSATRSRI